MDWTPITQEREKMLAARRKMEMINMPPGASSNRPFHHLQDLEAPFPASDLLAAATRKHQWHQQRARHWEAEAKRIYTESMPAALEDFESTGKAMYTGGGMRHNEPLEHAKERLRYHRSKAEEFANAGLAFSMWDGEYRLHIPIRIMVELDLAGSFVGAPVAGQDGID